MYPLFLIIFILFSNSNLFVISLSIPPSSQIGYSLVYSNGNLYNETLTQSQEFSIENPDSPTNGEFQCKNCTKLEDNPPCKSDIFCFGPILKKIQLTHIFPDDKTFVDAKLKSNSHQIRANFDLYLDKYYYDRNLNIEISENSTRAELVDFVNENFILNMDQCQKWDPEDWKENPAFITKIKDTQLQKFALDIHKIWKKLGRKVNKDVKENPELYSMIYVENPFIVPGGRFREFYYWDSYWTFQGLLLSEMQETVKGMLENFMYLVELKGYVPNGGRIYYKRSQPPLLIPMVKLYFDATEDLEFIKKHLETMVKEFEFWTKNRSVTFIFNGKNYTMLRYNVELDGPRPEEYVTDFKNSEKFTNPEEKREFFYNMKSAAESGWDFSTRWLKSNNTNNSVNGLAELRYTKIRDIIPVDLNSFYYRAAFLLAEFHKLFGKDNTEFLKKAEEIKSSINEVFWDEREGSWFDFDFIEGKRRIGFYISNLTPLWAKAENDDSSQIVRILDYLKRHKVLEYPGGIPTSLTYSGEQWDLYNAWAPLQEIFVTALENSGSYEAKIYAYETATKWVQTTYLGFIKYKTLFEKYNSSTIGDPGNGGVYEVVEGFGWTNGLILKFLNDYGDKMKSISNLIF